jgi:hypothetical protein
MASSPPAGPQLRGGATPVSRASYVGKVSSLYVFLLVDAALNAIADMTAISLPLLAFVTFLQVSATRAMGEGPLRETRLDVSASRRCCCAGQPWVSVACVARSATCACGLLVRSERRDATRLDGEGAPWLWLVVVVKRL